MTGGEWTGAVASLLLHGSLLAAAIAVSGFAHDVDTVTVIDFSLLPSRPVPGDAPAEGSAPAVEAEQPAAHPPVAAKPPAAVKQPMPVIERDPPPREPAPLLQEETATAAPVPVPVDPVQESVDDVFEEPPVVEPAVTSEAVPTVKISDADKPAKSEYPARGSATLPNNDRTGHSAAASGGEDLLPTGDHDGGDSLSMKVPSGTAGAGGDSPAGDADLQRDFSYIREKVQRNTRYPRLAREMGLEGQVKVSFTVCDDGQVRDIKVMESSGASILDKCAVDAVKKTSPFPSQQLEAKVIIPIVYKLSR